MNSVFTQENLQELKQFNEDLWRTKQSDTLSDSFYLLKKLEDKLSKDWRTSAIFSYPLGFITKKPTHLSAKFCRYSRLSPGVTFDSAAGWTQGNAKTDTTSWNGELNPKKAIALLMSASLKSSR